MIKVATKSLLGNPSPARILVAGFESNIVCGCSQHLLDCGNYRDSTNDTGIH